MVSVHGSTAELHTRDTSLLLYTGRGLAENLYYGGRIRLADAGSLTGKAAAGYGGDVLRAQDAPALSSLLLELSPERRGDFRRGALSVRMPHGGFASDFAYRTAALWQGPAPGGGMPYAKGADEVLALSFSEPSGLEAELFYSVFYEANVITRRTRLTNRGAAPAELRRCLSAQLDLPRCDLELWTFTGAWAREFHPTVRPLEAGITAFGNGTGASGARCNPFFFLAEKTASERHGAVYGFNLVYSGSHEGSAEVDTHGRTRVLHGIWSDGFSWTLSPGEAFVTPEAVWTYSDAGRQGMSRNMHRFVKNHILPKRWQNAPRPIVANNWEGTYFRFDEGKILRMARAAARLGAELFVLDDGWFGARNSPNAGLGDYDVNRKKLPRGLAGLCGRINAMGLEFGLWVEPEMVSEDSKLYRAHPGWAVSTPGYAPAKGRNQLVLDLCRTEVRDYIVGQVTATLRSANIRYIKWDMNRHLSDEYSPALANQGEFHHRYILGLYELFERICAANPDVLFEGCASGGNRFDLGVLCYMPQIWLSDDSDAHERQKIQTGASYGYPPCVMSCHVSAVPNHQTLRVSPLDTRFHTAAFGLLGYELDMTALPPAQRAAVREQTAFYKRHRRLLQYGEFYRLVSPFGGGGDCRWAVVAGDGGEALAGDFMGLLVPNTHAGPLKVEGLLDDALYEVTVRGQKIELASFGGLVNYVLPMHVNPDGLLMKAANRLYRMDTETERYTAYGSQLRRAGIVRLQAFSGAGYSEGLRFVGDFASRMYHLKRLPDNARAEGREADACPHE